MSTSAPKKLFDYTPGAKYGSPSDLAWPPHGLHLEVNFVPPQPNKSNSGCCSCKPGGCYAPPCCVVDLSGVVLTVHFEMYDGLPVLRKWVSVSHEGQNGAKPIVVNQLNYEMLRSPNFAPERISVVKQQANNPVPFDQQVKPQVNQSFPGNTEQLWFWDPRYDQCCDQEIHVTYTYYTFLVVGYTDSVRKP